LAVLGLVPLETALIFLAAAVGMGILLSVNAMLLEEISFRLYARPAQQVKLFALAVLENFGYRQMNSWWRFVGTLRWLFGKHKRHNWGRIKRDGSWQQVPEPAPPPEVMMAGASRPRTPK